MTGVLTPAQALAYLLELSPVITAARMVDRAGATIASCGANATGDAGPQARAEHPASLDRGAVVRASDDELELICFVSDGALADLVRADAAAALAGVRCRC